MIEVRLAIAGFEGLYEVSSLGRVRAVEKMQRYVLRNGVEAFRCVPEHLVSQQVNNSGYSIVHLYKGNKRHAKTVHRLVADAFCFEIGPEVNHLDGNKQNNCCSNLEWTTRSENLKHARRTGLR